ncbi:MAG: hypothetical protein LH475_05995 [Cryobacterium sp.]|uniref:hypothetical protein n=1 Tax=unclassified Cryobacterium TaxID=2649013 RepID=UPI0018C93002|nr:MULTISPECIES: hypothetical protein [unclassified Cryobacterium]MCY7404163.1 hypothetical protein [Cryobacterium sp.]MEC5154551.1 hypothetical protein [Cryobacterium sp. CAN_C3]
MRHELTIAALRDAVMPLLAPTVREVSFSDEHPKTWTLLGGSTGIVCEVEYCGNWYVQLDDWYVLELWSVGETRLTIFLASFDVKPVQLVTARIGARVVGSWLRFADGIEFEDPTWMDKLIARCRGYSLQVTPWVTGTERFDLIPD